jgi:GR25 family glycosyltransferase involved in LPS biosynthesis
MNYPVYCINLKERSDRKRYVEKEFEELNIQPVDVIFLDLYRHKNGGIYGCYDSHMKVWNDFYINHPDKEMCIVFEDDIKATKNSNLYLKMAVSFIKKNKDKVDILFLHNRYIKYKYKKNNQNNNYFVNGYGFLTHAYIVTRRHIQNIMNNNHNKLPKPNGIHFDLDMNFNKKSILYSENIYYCVNSVFNQKNEKLTDNYNNIIDKMIKKKYGCDLTTNMAEKCVKYVSILFSDTNVKKIVIATSKIYCFNFKLN